MCLQTVGEAIGLAFLIVNDILRSTSDEDGEEEPLHASYVSLLGIDQALETAANLQETARLAIESIPGDTSLLTGLADLITHRA